MEISCIIYSELDGSKIKTWNISQQETAKEEYKIMRLNNEEVGYFEGIMFPLDNFRYKYNSNKKIFEVKTDRELVEQGFIVLKKFEKLVGDKIISRELHELYEEKSILTKNHEVIYKIDRSNNLKRKNIKELLEIGFDEKEIRDGILEKVIILLDSKNYSLIKKYPKLEYINFNFKSSMAHLWNSLKEPSKLRILRSSDRINSFNILISEFYNSLSIEDQKNESVLLDKMNELVEIIITHEKLYKENSEKLINARNNFTKKIREMKLSEESIKDFLKEINDFYGEEKLFIEDIELSSKYYSTIPNIDTNFYTSE